MSTPDRQRLQRLLGGDALARLRERLRRRLQAGEPTADRFAMTHLTAVEAETLAGLLGRRQRPRASMRLSHDELDKALSSAGLADNLRAALECLDGPIIDKHAREEQKKRAWADVFARARQPQWRQLLTQPSVQGVVKRLAKRDVTVADQLVRQVDQVLARLPAGGTALARLAADTLGDAHALDTSRPVATLTLRVLAVGETATRPRDLWASQGVLVNELAKPVVTLNLAVDDDTIASEPVRAAARMGEPLHLSLRFLNRHPPVWRVGQTVHVCENPEVLAAAADWLGADCPAMVSLDGQLSAAPRILLDQLAAARAEFRYHGDFDWGGLRIANHFFGRYQATPWLYEAADYQPLAGPALKGQPVAACWDPALAQRMREAGIGVHEESVLERLIADLVGQV